MKLLLSIGERILNKLAAENIFELINKYDENKYVSGIELMTKDYNYLLYFASKCKERKLIFQCHAPVFESFMDMSEYLIKIDEISKKLEYEINIVFHSVEMKNIVDSINYTNKFIEEIFEIKEKNNLKIKISLENLNFLNNTKRINVDNIDKILAINPQIKYTYDMGHDIFDNYNVSKMSELQKERLNNVHIHYYMDKEDHHPITKEKTDLEIIEKGFNILREAKYDDNVVLEYGIDFIEGNTYEEKLIEYIKSFKIINKLMKK